MLSQYDIVHPWNVEDMTLFVFWVAAFMGFLVGLVGLATVALLSTLT